jgi:hypothetical protein
MADSQGRASFQRSLADALGTAGLRRLQLNWTAASVGSWTFFIVLAVYAYNEGGAAAVGVAALARMVPAGLAAPLAGAIVDRRSRRDVLLGSVIGRALLLGAIGAAVAAEAPLAVVLALAAVFTALATAHKPAQAALLPALAETPRQIAASNAVITAGENVGFLAGSLLGGTLISAASIETAFFANAAMFAVAAWPLARIHRDPVPVHREHAREGERALEELVSGFRTVARDPSLRLLVGVSASSTLVEGAADVMVVLVAIELLDLGNAAVGWLNSAWAVGGIVGGAAAISLLGRGRLAAGLAGGCLMVGIPLVVVAALPHVPVAVAALLILGSGYSLIETANLTLLRARLAQRSATISGRQQPMATSAPRMPRSPTSAGAMIAPSPVVIQYEAGAAIPEHAFALLRRVPLFAPLPIGTLENVARRVDELDVPAGQPVVREGEPGDRFYVIAKGDFDVSCSGGAFPPLSDGDVLGEIALLRNVPRTATVTARTDAVVFALDRDSFLSAVGDHRFSTQTVDELASDRAEREPAASAV